MMLLLTAAALMLFGNLLSSRAAAALRPRPYGEPQAQPADWALGIGGAMSMIGGVLLVAWVISISWLLALGGAGLLIGNQMCNSGTIGIRENPQGSAEEEWGRRVLQRGIMVCLSSGVLAVVAIMGLL
jgi:hypothetical protein